MRNYEELFYRRHEERKDIWGLPDEVCKAAVDAMLAVYDRECGNRDAIVDYDDLAINAEIAEKSDMDEGQQERYKDADYLFETDNYVCFMW